MDSVAVILIVALVVLVLVLVFVGLYASTRGAPRIACTSNSGCGAGEVCNGGTCSAPSYA